MTELLKPAQYQNINRLQTIKIAISGWHGMAAAA